MQLTERKDSLRQGLALAACALAGASHPASATDTPWSIDSAVLFYSESDRVTVVEPVVFASRDIGNEQILTLRGVFDTMSGASPNGATASNTAQTFTSPSGNTTYTAAAGETPKRSFRDQRVSLGLDWVRPFSRLVRNTLATTLSNETDYFSLGISDTLTLDSDDRRTTWSLGLALTRDQIEPEGGTPVEFQSINAPAPVPAGDDDGEEQSKTVAEIQLGMTRVLSRRSLLQANVSFANHSGYLTDPYKMLSVVNATTGATEDYLYEKRPDSRASSVLYLKWAYHLERDVFHLSYRNYSDDWGIGSNTVQLKYRHELGDGHYLMPHLRWYNQSAADFYRHSLVAGETVQEASADQRLGQFTGTTIGVKYGMPLAGGDELSVRAEVMHQEGESHPSDAIGLQKQVDLFPALDAYIVQIGYSTTF